MGMNTTPPSFVCIAAMLCILVVICYASSVLSVINGDQSR